MHTDHRAWPAGPVHALRPVFRELGVPAAFAYEQLERANTRISRFDVAARTGLSASADADALRTLAEHGLATRDRDGWRLGPASLRTLAEVFGLLQVLTAIRGRYAGERAVWRAKLAAWRQEHRPLPKQARAGPSPPSGTRTGPADEPFRRPPQEKPLTALGLLADRLGGYAIEP